jgi:hypothetical protein
MGLPLDDPQFWIVTALALAAAGFLLRMVIPSRAVRRKRTQRKATLTVRGKTIQKP